MDQIYNTAPFDVLIEEAITYQYLEFQDKLIKVKNLVKRALPINAYENREKDIKYYSLVFDCHSLSDALELKAGCCRYLTILFYILGGVSHLGYHHMMRFSKINESFFTCFNLIIGPDQTLQKEKKVIILVSFMKL